jgi:hypothetical protein
MGNWAGSPCLEKAEAELNVASLSPRCWEPCAKPLIKASLRMANIVIDFVTQTVGHSERVAQQNADTIAEQSKTVSELVGMANRFLAARDL